jgi:hypothetical protein
VRGANVDRPLDSGTALREGADPLNERPSAPTSRQAASPPCSLCKFCCVHALLPRVHALLLPRVSLRAIICHLPLRACGTLRWRPMLCCSHALLLPHSCTATYSVLSLCVKEQWPTRVVPPRACVFCCSHVFCNRPSCHTAAPPAPPSPTHYVLSALLRLGAGDHSRVGAGVHERPRRQTRHLTRLHPLPPPQN